MPFAAYTIGELGELLDRSGSWHTAFGIGHEGAVLVRPDGHIAWRAKRRVSNPLAEVTDALSRILARRSGLAQSVRTALRTAPSELHHADRIAPLPPLPHCLIA